MLEQTSAECEHALTRVYRAALAECRALEVAAGPASAAAAVVQEPIFSSSVAGRPGDRAGAVGSGSAPVTDRAALREGERVLFLAASFAVLRSRPVFYE